MKKSLLALLTLLSFTISVNAQTGEINVLGNSQNILDGDMIPTTADHTDFGSVLACSGTITRTYTVQNIGPFLAGLEVTGVSISGVNASEFTVVTSPVAFLNGGSSSILQITFDPAGTGSRTAIVTITSDDVDEASYDFAIRGTGNSDLVNPVASCRSLSIYLGNVSGTVGITAPMLNNGSSDNCGIASMSVSPTSYSCANVGVNTATLTVTDGSGNSAFCTSSVTVLDSSHPVANCRSLTLYLNGSGSASVVPAMVNNGSTDNCGIASMNVSPNSFSCANIGSNNVTLTVTDPSGNSSACVGVVTVLDSTHPVITFCPSAQSIVAGAGCVGIVPDYSAIVTGTDNCGVSSITQISPLPGASVGLGTTVPVTVRVTDASGNSSNCVFNLTVVGPEINVTGNSVSIPAGDMTPSTADYTDFGSVPVCAGTVSRIFMFDNTGNSALTLGPVTITGTNAGDFIVTGFPPSSIPAGGFGGFQILFNPTAIGLRSAIINLTNGDCNENPYSFAISGMGEAPEMNVLGNGLSIADGDVTPTTADHSDFGSVLTCTGNIIRTYTVENTGNSTLTVGAITITGVNASDFSLYTQSVVVLPPGGSGTFQIRFDPSANGLRSAIIHISNDDCDESPYDFTVQGTGNADIVNPVAICQNITLQLNAAGSATIVPAMLNNGSTDNCGIASMSVSQNSFSCANYGPNSVTLTVTDNSGNSSSCTAIVTVADTVRPVVTCLNSTVYLNAAGNGFPIPTMPSDACGISTYNISPNSFSCANVGSNNVTLTATDVHGNVSVCNSTVTVIDTVRPVANTQNISLYLNAFGNATVNGAMINNGSSDACGIASMTVAPSSFSCANVGANNVLFTVTDVNGNTRSRSAVVTVIDTVRPVAICHNTTKYLDAAGNGYLITSDLNNGSSDACGISAFSVSPSGFFNCSTVSPRTYTLGVQDINMNISYCTSVITILDTVRPVAIAQNRTVTLSGGTATVSATFINNGSSDACGIANLSVTPNTFTCSNLGQNTVTLTVTDVHGNTSTATAVVTVLSNLTSTAAVSTNVNCFGGSNGQASITTTGGAGPFTYSWSPSGGTSATASGLSAGMYTVTATDGGGCTTSSTVNITEPLTAPGATSVSGTILCNGGSTTVTVAGNGGTSPYTGAGTFTVTAGTYSYTVTDANGCTSSTSITVTQPAALSASSSATSILCNGGNATVTVAGSGGTAPYTGAGTFTVTAGTYSYPVTDANGCTSTTSVTVTEPNVLAATSSATSVLCNGGTTSVTVTGSGGTSPYAGEGAFTVSAGTYSYTVTDANGCTATTSVTVTEPTALAATSSATSISCNGGTATVTVTGSGGTAPYTGDGTFIVTAGTYSYTVTDANGCTFTTSVAITEPTAIATSIVSANVLCNGGSDGSIDLTVNGGTGPYTFDWNSGTYTTEDLTGLSAGTYAGVLTDANGCTNGGTIIITEPAVLLASVTAASGPTTCSGTDGAIDISVSGGTTAYSFLWNTSATSEDLSGVIAGSYTCVVTDANGCTANTGTVLNDPNAPTVLLSLPLDTFCLDDVAITLTGESPAGGTFSGSGVSAGLFDPAIAGIGTHAISYTYTDVNGCTGSTVDSINVDACLNASPNSSLLPPFSIYPNPNNGTFTLIVNTTAVVDVLIYDAQGKLISSQKVQPTVQEQLYIGAAGMYMVTVITVDGQHISQRVIVAR